MTEEIAPAPADMPEGHRPTGKIVITLGCYLLALTPLLLLAGGLAEPERISYVPDVTMPNPWRFAFFVMAGIAMNVGILLLLAGYIVRAIAFLPGRGDAFEAQMKTPYSSEPGQFAPREQR